MRLSIHTHTHISNKMASTDEATLVVLEARLQVRITQHSSLSSLIRGEDRNGQDSREEDENSHLKGWDHTYKMKPITSIFKTINMSLVVHFVKLPEFAKHHLQIFISYFTYRGVFTFWFSMLLHVAGKQRIHVFANICDPFWCLCSYHFQRNCNQKPIGRA